MLKPNSFHRRLLIVASPGGDYWTPTYPEDYSSAKAAADILLQSLPKYFFQRIVPTQKRAWWGGKVVGWTALDETAKVNGLSKWMVLSGRPFQVPKFLNPEEANKILKNLSAQEG